MRPALLAVLLVTAGLVGCIGGDGTPAESAAANASTEFTPCEHPWPCADGSEWPRNLTAPDEHPRHPAVIPDSLSMEKGEVVERNAKNVTFRWTVTTETATLAGPVDARTYQETTVSVPDGLYLQWMLEVESKDENEVDGRSLDLRLKNGTGKTVCSTRDNFADSVVGNPGTCTSDVVKPLDAPADWTVELEHEQDRSDDMEIEVTLKTRVAEPRLNLELDRLEHVRVESHDGTELDGYIYHPRVPDGVQVPVLLWASPYFGQTQPSADDPNIRDDPSVPVGKLIERGYAVALFNVRGTGNSGGCHENWGPREQQDQAVLVDWLAQQEWSNGRVAMMGLSYHGTTPWEAAIQSPDALKTIVVAGMVSDPYTYYHGPQGAAFTTGAAVQTGQEALITGPPLTQTQRPGRTAERWAPVAPDRACPEVARTLTTLYQGTATDDRNPDYWRERRLIDEFRNVTAAVLLTHGFQDRWGSGHAQQELAAWQALPEATPKHQLEGQWKHQFPNQNSYNESWTLDDWHERLFTWLDFWLKGVGDPPVTIGTVEYQDGTGDWHETTAWPPAEARRKALYLSGGNLASAAGDDARTFHSVPDPAGSLAASEAIEGWPGPLCTRDAPDPGPAHGLLYATEPLDERALVAGNPFAYLTLESDQPGGLVTMTLLDLAPGFRCDGPRPSNARALTTGAADLRFHEGTYQGSDFPTGTPTQVRIDLTNLAQVIEPGHRLAALVSYGNPALRTSQPYTPTVDVHGQSHLVLPVVEGEIGAELPDVDYPPRPFVPPYNGTGGPDP